MIKKSIKFDEAEIKKYKFYQNESPISVKDIDIKKILDSNKFAFGKKGFLYFIGYKDD